MCRGFAAAVLCLASGVAAQSLQPLSISVIIINDDGVLFVADSMGSMIFAYPPSQGSFPINSNIGGFRQQPQQRTSGPYNIKNVDSRIAALLGTATNNIFLRDLAVNPQTKEAYIAVETIRGGYYAPAIVIMDSRGQGRIFDLNSYRLPYRFFDGPKTNYKFWDKTPMQKLTFTDMDFYKNKLYVSGLTNGDFASSFRAIDYPFNGKAETITVEMYHTQHSQNETRAPIRTMKIVNIAGRDIVIAAYTCTPLVAFPLDAVRNGAHINAKTISELGYGNTPIDLLSFMTQDFAQNTFPVLFLSNKQQSAQLIKMSDVESALRQPGMTTFQQFNFGGIKSQMLPMAGVIHMDNLDDKRILAVRRDYDSGAVDLVTYSKGLFFRVTDFISEMTFPSYRKDPSVPALQSMYAIEDSMMTDEGFPPS